PAANRSAAAGTRSAQWPSFATQSQFTFCPRSFSRSSQPAGYMIGCRRNLVSSPAAARATTSTTRTTASSSASRPASTSAAISTMVAASRARSIAVEVRFRLVRKVAAALDSKGRRRRRNSLSAFDSGATFAAGRHFGPLLFEDRLAGQLDAVAFDRQHFHQHLVAFLQFVANILDPVLRHFADVQQPLGAGNDLDERAEIRQPRDFAQVGFADFGGCRQIADDLQRLVG